MQSLGEAIAPGYERFLVDQTDSYMYRRLTGQWYNTLLSNTDIPKGQRTPLNANMQGMVGFEFNSHSPFTTYFFPEISTSLDSQRQITVGIPAFDPKTQMLLPEHATAAELLVYVYATTFDPNTPIVDAFFSLPIAMNGGMQPETAWISPALPVGYYVMVTAKVMYFSLNKFTGKNYINSKELNPAVVLFSCAVGN